MSKLTYQQRSNQSTRIPVGQRRTVGGKVLEDNRAAFAAKQLKQDETAQRAKEEDERLKGKSAAQLAKKDEEETAQAKFSDQAPPVQLEEKASKPNNTGLPDKLKNGIESLSGLSMDNVKVHYNSAKPSQLNALAYAQGTDIHVAPGQEKHLPHEAWHVVQQSQGRVKPTMQMKKGTPINDDKSLEHEADVMGKRAMLQKVSLVQRKGYATPVTNETSKLPTSSVTQLAPDSNPASAKRIYTANGDGTANTVEGQVNAISNGGVPTASPVGWADVLSGATKVKGSWVRFHLLNQWLGGSGSDPANLVPTTVGINHNATWRQMEQEAQGIALSNNWVWWYVTVAYHAAAPMKNHDIGFPSSIRVQAKEFDGSQWQDLTAGNGDYTLAVTEPDFSGGTPERYFHEITGSQWSDLVGLTNSAVIGVLVANSQNIKTLDDISQLLYSEQYNFQNLDEQFYYMDQAVQGKNSKIKILIDE